MQLTPLSYLHANREYILLKLINKELVVFTYINLYFENSFHKQIWWIIISHDQSDIMQMSYQNVVYQNWLQ